MVKDFAALWQAKGVQEVTDTGCDSTLYDVDPHDGARYFTNDGLHPNQNGQNEIARDWANEFINMTQPLTTCTFLQ